MRFQWLKPTSNDRRTNRKNRWKLEISVYAMMHSKNNDHQWFYFENKKTMFELAFNTQFNYFDQ